MMNAGQKTSAGIVRRTIAYLIDVTLLYLAFAVTQTFLNLVIPGISGIQWRTSGPLLEAYIFLTISLPIWFYFALSERSAWQATVGKRLPGLRVAGADGGPIGFGRAMLRTIPPQTERARPGGGNGGRNGENRQRRMG